MKQNIFFKSRPVRRHSAAGCVWLSPGGVALCGAPAPGEDPARCGGEGFAAEAAVEEGGKNCTMRIRQVIFFKSL